MDIDQKVKCCQLDLLKELDRICKKWDIPYFLIGGTLIGAIRHKGFIPWDDDLDVGLLWEHYDRLKEACDADLDPAYELHDWHKDPHSPHPFYKLKIRGTHYPEEVSADSGMNDGIFIDIFPYDNAPDDEKLRKRQGRQVFLLRRILQLRCGFSLGKGSPVKKLLYGTLKLLSGIRSVESWKRSFEALRQRYNHGTTQIATNMCGAYSYQRESKPRVWLETVTDHVFEGMMFSIPENYDGFLRSCYGDYMQLPPEAQRVGIHHVQAVDFGDYTIRTKLAGSDDPIH